MDNNQNTEFLYTNLKPYFWSDIANVIRQNKNSKLLQFLFGNDTLNYDSDGRINYLEERIIHLETELKLIKGKKI